MSTILDDHMAQNPGTWRDLFRRRKRPSALELAVSALEECRRDALDEAQRAEYHAAMVRMLKERETRLCKEVARLSKNSTSALTKEPSHGAQQAD